MNTCLFTGRLTSDPELVRLESGKVTTNFTLAVARPYRNSTTDEFDTDFIRIVCWEGMAEAICRYVKKGQKICIRCHVTSRFRDVGETKVPVIEFVGELCDFFSTIQDGTTNETEDCE